MNGHDAFSPPKSHVADVVPLKDSTAPALILTALVAFDLFLSRGYVAAGLRLVDEGALNTLEFLPVLLAYGLLPVGMGLMLSRWRGAFSVSVLCACCAVLAGFTFFKTARVHSPTLLMANAAWVVLPIAVALLSRSGTLRDRAARESTAAPGRPAE